MSLTQQELIQVVSAAAASVGQVDASNFDTEVTKRASQIILAASDQGRVAKHLNALADTKPFVATIFGVKIEPRTKRGFVVVKSQPSDRNPDGIEHIRTDIVDGNPLAEDLVLQVRAAKGKRALVYKHMEQNGDQKYRVLKAIQVIGDDPEFNDENAKAVAIARFNKEQK